MKYYANKLLGIGLFLLIMSGALLIADTYVDAGLVQAQLIRENALGNQERKLEILEEVVNRPKAIKVEIIAEIGCLCLGAGIIGGIDFSLKKYSKTN